MSNTTNLLRTLICSNSDWSWEIWIYKLKARAVVALMTAVINMASTSLQSKAFLGYRLCLKLFPNRTWLAYGLYNVKIYVQV